MGTGGRSALRTLTGPDGGEFEKKDFDLGAAKFRVEALASLAVVLRRSGDLSEAPEPDPIPNSAVKRLSANGTVSQDPGE